MKAIEIISIPVTDQARAKAFYKKLGFEVIVEAPFGNGQQWVQMGFPGQDTSITLVNWFPEMPAGCVQGFIIKTENIEDDVKELTEKGISVGKIDSTPWGRFLPVKDPDGNTWSFHES
ncbi:VOC family protein [Mucilaginibacter xinganensis]|uniref:Glyoxalase-like domain protein n=1 Tax=Mucilaginibacter xinganensis TaxID=1234841 RepID=A0A223P0W0_9SPHI|nr:VOC family protein [Mucilaginibacter xinganensis]ASU35584.1 Glyoxalase-like domain protein [Mucilaginibacter xinganensis]